METSFERFNISAINLNTAYYTYCGFAPRAHPKPDTNKLESFSLA